ncbi:GntR family transcriptional regulator [Streptomyces narbonensis]|uniref:GntR family transcriptional regulator n=1 Tax=Streptomyces narbonensis TaxID=67333 RepID=A0ABV3CAI1_9ACTN
MAEPDTEATEVPLYLRVAAVLREDLAHRRISPGSRLPSERSLSQRYHVNRQTVRSALQLLRDERLVVTDRRGTFAAAAGAAEPVPPPIAARRPTFPGGPRVSEALVRASLTWEPPPTPLTSRLLLAPGEPTLVHRHLVFGPQGAALQRAVSWFSRPAISEIPQLARYRRIKDSHHQPDLRLLYHWMHQAGLRVTHRESIGVPPVPSPPASTSTSTSAAPGDGGGGAARLVVHRVVSDQHGHALEITDIDFSARSAAWTYEFSA